MLCVTEVRKARRISAGFLTCSLMVVATERASAVCLCQSLLVFCPDKNQSAETIATLEILSWNAGIRRIKLDCRNVSGCNDFVQLSAGGTLSIYEHHRLAIANTDCVPSGRVGFDTYARHTSKEITSL